MHKDSPAGVSTTRGKWGRTESHREKTETVNAGVWINVTKLTDDK
jgi:hypothetical protein